jgi:hypothetical protein
VAQALKEAETVATGPPGGNEGMGGGGGASGSFCAKTQKVAFTAEETVSLGEEIRLIIGKPPTVRSRTGVQIGSLSGSAAAAMRNCIELGYEMAGVVSALSADHKSGELIITGRAP